MGVGGLTAGIRHGPSYGRALLWGTGSAVALTVSVAIFAIVVWANVLG